MRVAEHAEGISHLFVAMADSQNVWLEFHAQTLRRQGKNEILCTFG
jgi:hypothetical protein